LGEEKAKFGNFELNLFKFIAMKFILTTTFFLLLNVCFAQEMEKDPVDGCPIFKMADGDTVYVMKQYFMVFYKSGPERSQEEDKVAEIQAGHMEYINEMGKGGYLSIAGPFGGETDLRGVLIFNVASVEKVNELMQGDPAVQVGRLTYEIHPWWGAKGSSLK
jgi:uncharacterized protein YciI